MNITPQIHERIRTVYEAGVGSGEVAALAKELGEAPSTVNNYANKQGWISPKCVKTATGKALEMRERASLECEHFKECLAVAAKENKSMHCHKCERNSFVRDNYQKEVDMGNINNTGAVEHAVKTEVIGCGPGGEPETRVCSQPDCEHGGKPQPIENFRLHPMHGTRFKKCNTCLSKSLRAGQQRRQERRKQEKKKIRQAGKPAPQKDMETQQAGKPAPQKDMETQQAGKPVPQNSVGQAFQPAELENKNILVIDFSKHPETLERIKEIAADKLRKPKNQVLYWLKEFSLILEKEEANEHHH